MEADWPDEQELDSYFELSKLSTNLQKEFYMKFVFFHNLD